jgi:hypothetical protein
MPTGGRPPAGPTTRASSTRANSTRANSTRPNSTHALTHCVGTTRPSGATADGTGARAWAQRIRAIAEPRNDPKTSNEAPKGLVRSVEIRRRPTLPGSLPPSTIGAGGLNCRVRDGNGCDPTAMATEICCQGRAAPAKTGRSSPRENSIASTNIIVNPSPRPISTGRLNTSPCLHLRPINVVIWPRALPGYPVGDLISERASHLDAFSAYLFRRWLTSRALGRTTGTPELRPSRSSRTRDSLPQISYGCRG